MGQLFSRRIALEDISPNDNVIVVIGPAGAGKSTFINTAAGQILVEVGHGLDPWTTKVEHVRCTIKLGGFSKQVVFVDTPAFPGDESGTLTERDVEKKIWEWSKKTFGKNVRINGILYLYKITDNRMTEPPHLLFKKLCGDGFHGQVLLVTTMWEKLKDQEVGEKRKAGLEGYWRRATDKAVVCHNGTKQSAWEVVEALMK